MSALLCCLAAGHLLPSLQAPRSSWVSLAHGSGTKAALLLAERADQMFNMLAALIAQHWRGWGPVLGTGFRPFKFKTIQTEEEEEEGVLLWDR